MQYDIQDRRSVYKILEKEGIELPRHAIFDRSDLAGILQTILFSENIIRIYRDTL